MLDKYLQEIGLNEKEAAVYLMLIQVDDASVIDIAKKTEINRTTVYIVLESLEKKGLVSETTAGKKTHYHAEPPERLETYVQRQKVILDEHSKRLVDIIPQLKSVQRETGVKPIVKLYEGKEGIISLNEDLYENNDQGGTAYLIYSSDLLDSVFSKEDRAKYKKVRLEKGVKTKVLYNSSKGDIPSDQTGDRVKIDEKKYPVTCDISVYKDRVRIGILGKKLSGIFIKSQDLADTLRSLFNFALDSIKKEGPAA
jgi:sugar-specific transcriptional regulator TrmB